MENLAGLPRQAHKMEDHTMCTYPRSACSVRLLPTSQKAGKIVRKILPFISVRAQSRYRIIDTLRWHFPKRRHTTDSQLSRPCTTAAVSPPNSVLKRCKESHDNLACRFPHPR